MRLCRQLILIVAVLCATAPQSHAATEAEKLARRSFERAEAHFKAGLYGEALAEYQDGYDRLPLPGFLINIAQCQRRLGDLTQALSTYRKFILVAPDSPYVPEVKALVAEIEKSLESEQGAAAAGTKEEIAPPPLPVAAPVPDTEPSVVAQPAALVVQPVDDSPPRAETRWWLWGTVGAAVVAGVVTAVLLSRTPDNTIIHDGSIGTLRR